MKTNQRQLPSLEVIEEKLLKVKMKQSKEQVQQNDGQPRKPQVKRLRADPDSKEKKSIDHDDELYERQSLHDVLSKVISDLKAGKGSVGSRSPLHVTDERLPRLPAPVPYHRDYDS